MKNKIVPFVLGFAAASAVPACQAYFVATGHHWFAYSLNMPTSDKQALNYKLLVIKTREGPSLVIAHNSAELIRPYIHGETIVSADLTNHDLNELSLAIRHLIQSDEGMPKATRDLKRKFDPYDFGGK